MKRIFLSYFMALFFLFSAIFLTNFLSQNVEKNEISVLIKNTGEVVTMPVEQYITGVVCGEMPASFEDEALCAQAVAARTYMYYKTDKKNTHENAQICTDFSCCQAYVSKEDFLKENSLKNYEKIMQNVLKTKGEILTFEGKPILAVFHSAAGGGKTEKSDDVWTASLPYLTNVETFGETEKSNFFTTVTVTKKQFKEKIKENYPNCVPELPEISQISHTQGGAVDWMVVYGVKIKGTDMRKIFGLKSACFEIEEVGEDIVFKVKGAGHGVGMSQYGANYMAKQGKTYKEILKTYYQGTKITTR